MAWSSIPGTTKVSGTVQRRAFGVHRQTRHYGAGCQYVHRTHGLQGGGAGLLDEPLAQGGKRGISQAMTTPDATQSRQILQATERVVASSAFGSGERLPALMRYLVREQVEGRGDRVKAYNIGVDVFGRGSDFDPQTDSIVRVEMGRLRKSLDLYNATQGQGEPLQISFQVGSYRPLITYREVIGERADLHHKSILSAGNRVSLARWMAGTVLIITLLGLMAGWKPWLWHASPTPLPPRVAVLPVSVTPGGADHSLFANGLQMEIAAQMARQPWLSVIVPADQQASTPFSTSPARRADYELDSRLRLTDQDYELSVLLKHAVDQSVAWTATYRGPRINQQLAPLVSELASTIAAQTGQPGGAITNLELAKLDTAPDLANQQFLCMLEARRYWYTFDPAHRQSAKTCLNRLIMTNGGFSDGRAALALFAIDDSRIQPGTERDAHLAEAKALLDIAIPTEVLTLQAQMGLAACIGDMERVSQTAEQLLALSPNNPTVLADCRYKAGAGYTQLGTGHTSRGQSHGT
jgi:adenylate cyclase